MTAVIGARTQHLGGMFNYYQAAPAATSQSVTMTVTEVQNHDGTRGAFNSSGCIVRVPAVGAISLTQQAWTFFTSKWGTRPNAQVVLKGGTTAAGLLVLIIHNNGGTAPGRAVTGCGATWSRARTATGGTCQTDVWIGRNPTAGQTTVTMTQTGGIANVPQLVLAEFAGCDNAATSWVSSSATKSNVFESGSLSTGAVTPAVGDLLVASVSINLITDGFPPPPGAGTGTIANLVMNNFQPLQGIA